MAATLLDGAAIAAELLSRLKARIATLDKRGIQPGLAAILIGDNPASQIYIRNKERACTAAGVHSEVHRLARDCTDDEVLATIRRLNADPRIHGVLLQLPLPLQLSAERLLQAIDPAKDVDGFNWVNLGALVAGRAHLAPCTPLGVMAMLDHANVALEGCNAVVVGRSAIVGKPLALMLVARGATVSVCSSKTADLRQYTSMADVLAVAVGKPGLIDGSMIKPSAVVIDIGINRLPDGKIAGDVAFESARAVASRITPVPGGVGRMTVAMLLENTVRAAEHFAGAA